MPPTDQGRDNEDRYFDLDGLARYSGLSVSSLRRFLRDPDNPLPHHQVRGAGKTRGRIIVSKREFDAWVRAFRPSSPDEPPPPDVRWIRKAFEK